MIPGIAIASDRSQSLQFVGSVLYRSLIERYGFDPFMVMPPNAAWFDLFASRTVAFGGATTVVFRSLQIGANEWLRISALGMEADANSVVTIADLVYSLRLNGNPIRHYGAMSDQIGTGQRPTEIFVRIFQSGGLLEYTIINNHVSQNSLSFGRFQGWTIPH